MKRKKFQYIWIRKYHRFCNFEVNFSAKYKIHFDVDKNLIDIQKNQNVYLKDFYGKNMDLTLIVGENGTGKTTILRYLLQHAYGDGEIGDETSYISIIEEESDELETLNIYVHFSISDRNRSQPKVIHKDDIKIKVFTDYSKIGYSNNINESLRNNSFDIQFVYISDSFNQFFSNPFQNQINFSPYAELYSEIRDGSSKNPLLSYVYKTYKRQIKFVSENFHFFDKFSLNIPKAIFVEIPQNDTFKKQNEHLYSKIVKSFTKFETYTFVYYLSMSIIENVESKTFLQNLETILDDTELIDKLVNNEGTPVTIIKEALDRTSPFVLPSYDKIVNLVNYLLEIGNIGFVGHYNRFEIDFRNRRDINCINRLITLCDEIYTKNAMFFCYWNLSAGELSLINLFSKINSLQTNSNHQLVDNRNLTIHNVILLIDEPDVSLHPEWQRKLLYSLINMIDERFKTTHFQMFITTHSPLMLSDVLKQNVILLKSNKENIISIPSNDQKETFGSNIYDLYSNSFFLTEYIGEFSNNKIRETAKRLYSLYKYLKGDNNEIKSNPNSDILFFDYDKKIVDNIGEPILRKELTKYVKYINDNKDKLI